MMCQHEKHVKTIQSAFVGITARNPICRRVNRMRAKKKVIHWSEEEHKKRTVFQYTEIHSFGDDSHG